MANLRARKSRTPFILPIDDSIDKSVDKSIDKSVEAVKVVTKLNKLRVKKDRKYVEPTIYNPKFFTGGSSYDGIFDSSDSDNESHPYNVSDKSESQSDSDKSYSQSVSDKSDSKSASDKSDSKSASDKSAKSDKSASAKSDKSASDKSDKSDDKSASDKSAKSDAKSASDKSDSQSASDGSDDYFELDKTPLTKLLTLKLSAQFPHLSELDLKAALEKAMNQARTGMVEEYCGAIPGDESWKIDLQHDDVQWMDKELKMLRKSIKDKEPTIGKILKSSMLQNEKEKALQFYDTMKNMEPYSLQSMEINLKIIDMIISAPAVLDDKLNGTLKLLREEIIENVPTLEKIMRAFITKGDKIRALELYDSGQQYIINTQEWFNNRHQITSIISSQFMSEDEVALIEEKEENHKRSSISLTDDLKMKIFQIEAPDNVKNKLFEMYSEMMSLQSTDDKYSSLKSKIVWSLKLPHKRTICKTICSREDIRMFCGKAYSTLNSEMYGMNKVKQRIIQCLNNRLNNPKSRSLLALKGKPGVGKTKMAKTIAKAAGRPFEKISLGGAVDSTIFKGSDNVWIGSSPSLLLQLLARAKSSDAVILLDEIDKLGASEKGVEVQNALLHVLDPLQNKDFQDSYLSEYNHDISNVWFILALNDESGLTQPLRDRLDVIELDPYTREEMVEIIKRHTLFDALEDKGMNKDDVTITTEAAHKLLSSMGQAIKESGMRPIEKEINEIVSKLNMLRTLWKEDGFYKEVPLDFDLEDFKGFPYVITEYTITMLYKTLKQKQLSYYS